MASLITLGQRPLRRLFKLSDFPKTERLGRVVVGKVAVKALPDADSTTVGPLYEDAVIPWLRETVGPRPYRVNQRWVETPDGYIWSPEVQPVHNLPNVPVKTLPQTSLGPGMWMEVSVPYVDLIQANPPARAPWLQNRQVSGLLPRFFYSQIVWVDQIKTDEDGQVWYRLNEHFGYGDIFWGVAEAFRPLTEFEMAPLSPDVEEKRIRVDLTDQTMSCFEGNTEVYFARVSTGAMYNFRGERVDEWGTPTGRHRIWRKAVSLPLTGGSAEAGWALPAVGWISLFVGSGVAFHSTYWHNNYGVPTSRGCVNCSPDDAKWVFRWTLPAVSYDPGDVTVGMPGGTQIEVVEA
jgi:lipoprotein-anchoring transpeptidase ErfK/SrfK